MMKMMHDHVHSNLRRAGRAGQCGPIARHQSLYMYLLKEKGAFPFHMHGRVLSSSEQDEKYKKKNVLLRIYVLWIAFGDWFMVGPICQWQPHSSVRVR